MFVRASAVRAGSLDMVAKLSSVWGWWWWCVYVCVCGGGDDNGGGGGVMVRVIIGSSRM